MDGEVVDGNGEPILLRGFGLGGWLVPEGYMLHNQAWIEGLISNRYRKSRNRFDWTR